MNYLFIHGEGKGVGLERSVESFSGIGNVLDLKAQ